MHVEASHSHLRKLINLTQKLLLVQSIVPAPKRAPTILCRWVLKKVMVENLAAFWICQRIVAGPSVHLDNVYSGWLYIANA